MNKGRLSDVMAARYFSYMVLQSVFGTEPTPSQWDTLRMWDTREAFLSLGGDESYVQAVTSFFGYVRAHDFTDEVVSSYTKQFIGPSELAAAPWESVYVNNEPLLLVESTIEVRKAYLKEGYAPKLFPHVVDDHIALELDFMKSLAKDACDAIASGDDQRAESCALSSSAFMGQHLARWAAPYCSRLIEADDGFYRAAAALLESFVSNDQRLLGEIAPQ